jgi:hypothetical protein
MKKIDANGDGKLSLPEFAVLWDEMLVITAGQQLN